MISPLAALGAELPATASRNAETGEAPTDGGFLSALNAQMGESPETGLAGMAQTYASDRKAEGESAVEPAASATSPTLPDALLAAAILPAPIVDAAALEAAPEPEGEAAPDMAPLLSAAPQTAAGMTPVLIGQTAPVAPTAQAAPAAVGVESAAVAGTPATPAAVVVASAESQVRHAATTPIRDGGTDAVSSFTVPEETASPATERQALPTVASSSPSGGPAVEAAPSHPQQAVAPAPGLESTLTRPTESAMRNGPGSTASMMHMTVESPVRSAAFASDFADKVVWMAGKQEQWAELSLNPANLGEVEVRLSLTGEGAGAQFFSANPQVREALENALPRLKELFAQSGLALQDASVHDQSLPQRDGSGERGRSGGRSGRGFDEPALPAAHTLPRMQGGRGLVDLYA